MALQRRRDSMPCNPRGRMKGELNPMNKRCVRERVRAKEKERGSGEGNGDGLRNVRYRVLTVSAALCCFVGLLLPSASYAGDAGLAALQFPPMLLFDLAAHTLMRNLPICC